jgi:hypothetical protein
MATDDFNVIPLTQSREFTQAIESALHQQQDAVDQARAIFELVCEKLGADDEDIDQNQLHEAMRVAVKLLQGVTMLPDRIALERRGKQILEREVAHG